MSKFNSTIKSKPDATNLAGGKAYKQSPKLAIASLLLTSFASGSHYETESDAVERLKSLYGELSAEDKIFLAKAAIYARNEFGMRSITHIAANIILDDIKENKYSWASSFFSRVIFRPDDMSEIIACYWKDGKRSLPNSLLKGFRRAFNKFDNYQIAKYKMSDKDVSLIDIVRLVHPKPIERNAKALKELVYGTLKQTETWNAQLSAAGRNAKSDEEKQENKAKVWENFVAKGEKIEMMALLRNLKNIALQATSEVLGKALSLLKTKKLVTKSKILPFRFLTAYNEFVGNQPAVPQSSKITEAIAIAMEHSVSNVPKFEGKTLVALDASGSMFWDDTFTETRFAQGAVFAGSLFKSNDADLCLFSNNAMYAQNFNSLDSIITIMLQLYNQSQRAGTNFESIFELIKRSKIKYDRIIIISDEQSWCGNTKRGLTSYKSALDVNPKIYNIDVSGYGTLQFPEANCFCFAGISEKVFDLMSITEQDPAVLVNTIENLEL